MEYSYFALSDVGLQRSNNEDAVSLHPKAGLAVLADGMGGYNAGEVASALAVNLITKQLGDWLMAAPPTTSLREVRRATALIVDEANRAIFEASQSHPEYAGMGTTVVMAVLRGHHLLIAHVGDSRAYRWRDGQLESLTRDHSILQEQIDIGLLTPEEALGADGRNLVTRALGVEEAVLLDVNETGVRHGDLYLLCSDGLNDMVSDAEIGAVLRETRRHSLEESAGMLIRKAAKNGGRDNVSVVLIKAENPVKKSKALPGFLRK